MPSLASISETLATMNKLAILCIYGGFAVVGLANVLPVFRIDRPGSHKPDPVVGDAAIFGETVYARMENDGTQIEARFDLGVNGERIESVYFPVFATLGASPGGLLDLCKFYAVLGGTRLDDVVMARSPVGSPKAPTGSRIVWFQFMPKDQKEILAEEGAHLIFKISYWQPHVAGHFFYLPQSIAHQDAANNIRDWRFPMIVRSLNRITPNPDANADFDRIADLLIIYLRNAEVVSIPAPKNG